jgi:hypothetical protein
LSDPNVFAAFYDSFNWSENTKAGVWRTLENGKYVASTGRWEKAEEMAERAEEIQLSNANINRFDLKYLIAWMEINISAILVFIGKLESTCNMHSPICVHPFVPAWGVGWGSKAFYESC